MPAWRQEARRKVVATYFPPEEQVALAPTSTATPSPSPPSRLLCLLRHLRLFEGEVAVFINIFSVEVGLAVSVFK